MRKPNNLSKNSLLQLLKSQRKCKKLKLKNLLTKMNKKLRLVSKRERLKMKLQLKRKEESFTISKLNANQSRQLVRLRLKQELLPFNLKLKVKPKSKSPNSELKLERSWRLLSLLSKKKRLNLTQKELGSLRTQKSERLKKLEILNLPSSSSMLIVLEERLWFLFQRLVQSFRLRSLTLLASRVT